MSVAPELWVAHNHPELPLSYGACLCCCEPCALALDVAARHRPGMPIVLRTAMDRIVVPAGAALEARWAGCFERLLRVPEDWIREVFVGPGPDFRHVRLQAHREPRPRPCHACADDVERDDCGR